MAMRTFIVYIVVMGASKCVFCEVGTSLLTKCARIAVQFAHNPVTTLAHVDMECLLK